MLPGNCFRCGRPGHFAADCPELRPTADRREHERRISAYRQRFQNWLDGTGAIRWDPAQKKAAIETENRTHENEKAKERAKAK